jgi:hypothetical protein
MPAEVELQAGWPYLSRLHLLRFLMALSLPELLTRYLADECEIAGKQVRQNAASPEHAAYYLSAVWGAVMRVLNISYSPQLCHLFAVTSWVHRETAGRVEAMKSGQQASIGLLPSLFDQIGALVIELGTRVREQREVYDILEELCALGYAATGNGFYLATTRGQPPVEVRRKGQPKDT